MVVFKKTLYLSLILIILGIGLWIAMIWHRFIHTPMIKQGPSVVIQVPAGTGIHYLANTLQEKGLTHQPRLFIFMAQMAGEAYLLKAGEYEITKGMRPPDLLARIVSGKVMQHSITFIEGWTFQQMKEALRLNSQIKHTIDKLSDAQIMSQCCESDQHPEGLFFPDTYFFTLDDTDLSILKEAYQHMKMILGEAWQTRASGLLYKTPYEALIVASLLEKEASTFAERSKIAGVILRRLEKHMPLQVDPTVLYGLKRPYGSKITHRDLLSHTPYNTYQQYGLPPTPIDMPSQDAIEAALHPIESDALYYVASGNGSHIFSATYEAHLAAVKEYRQQLMAKQKVEDLPFNLSKFFLSHLKGMCIWVPWELTFIYDKACPVNVPWKDYHDN